MNRHRKSLKSGLEDAAAQVRGRPSAHAELDAPEGIEDLQARISDVVEKLRDTLVPLVQLAAGPSPRPSALARILSIDKTLSAKLIRAVRAPDTAGVLNEIPSPEGLRIFLSALPMSFDLGGRQRAAEAVRAFELLIDEFPGGRSALDAAAGEFSPALRERTQHAAKQGMFRAMSSLLGYSADVSLSTCIIQPSASGRSLDVVHILGKYGVRRIRPSGPVTLMGRQRTAEHATPLESTRVESVLGEVSTRPESYLIQDLCSSNLPPLQAIEEGKLWLCVLPENVPGINTPISVTTGHIVRNDSHRFAVSGEEQARESFTPRMPTRLLVLDTYVRRDTFAYPDPRVTATLMGLSQTANNHDSVTLQLDSVQLETPLVSMGKGLDGAECSEIPGYTRSLERVFKNLGWNASDFVGHRCRVQYPVPMVMMSFWFRRLTEESSYEI